MYTQKPYTAICAEICTNSRTTIRKLSKLIIVHEQTSIRTPHFSSSDFEFSLSIIKDPVVCMSMSTYRTSDDALLKNGG